MSTHRVARHTKAAHPHHEPDEHAATEAAPALPPEPEPSPAAKAAHCARCDARFVPSDGRTLCNECLASETKRRIRRGGYTRCRVKGNVVATGMLEDGHYRTAFSDGEVAEFSDEDVLSVPESLIPTDE